MDITRAKQQVLDTVRAYLATDADGLPRISPQLQRPLFLVGPPGIGKTAVMAQVASELGIGLVSYSMTHHTRQSALGLPVIEHCEYKGFAYDASEYTMSEIIASVYDYMRRMGVEQGILFLDEINCVSETLYPSMLQFLQFKTFGKHAVPQGWIVACAGNPPEYNRSVHEFDVVTLDRMRTIQVEPDVDAWMAYARNAGVHPAVTTFLETERDCFYRIESTPGGKRFVTARGWDDLARMIALNEELGIAVDAGLVAQFVQDPEIAERFSLYYDLFSKYKSDYQVRAILDGRESSEVRERARAAALDERMAVLGLLLDVLTPAAADMAVREDALTEVRDVLRQAKELLVSGGKVAEVLEPAIQAKADELGRLGDVAGLGAGVAGEARLRSEVRALAMLKACRDACAEQRLEGGQPAFSAIHQEFRGFVGTFEADVSALRSQIENAYAFLEAACGDGPEVQLFTTELTARQATAHFISRYGCEAFALANQGLQTTEARRGLLERIDAVRAGAADLDARPVTEEEGKAAGGAVELLAPTGGENAAELEAYYRSATWEFGYASLCHMALPAGLEGKTVLDLGCRRGKGVFKLSERVGESGRAIGIDWVPGHIQEATSRMERAARETGLSRNNMEFHLACPEDLMAIGLGDATVDVVFVNSVLHLTCNPALVLAEAYRVLKPDGLLVCEVALATAPRDASVVRAARELGNSIQSAPARSDFEQELSRLGFKVEVAQEPLSVAANQGFKKGHEVPTAPTTEHVAFQALVLHAWK